MATIIILILLVLYIVFAFHRSRKRIKNGCCGGGGPVFRDSVQTDQYAIHEQYHIRGMHCESCAASIEHRLNQMQDTAALVNLQKEVVDVDSNHPLNKEELFQAIQALGYEAYE